MCINQHTFEYFWRQYQSADCPQRWECKLKKVSESRSYKYTHTHTHTHTHTTSGDTHYKWGHNVPTRYTHKTVYVCVVYMCVCVCI